MEEKMNKAICYLLAATCMLSGCDAANPNEASKAITQSQKKASGVVLTEGVIKIESSFVPGKGVPDKATLVKVPWKKWGTHVIQCAIPDTPFSVIVVAGRVKPLVANVHTRELWRIDGLKGMDDLPRDSLEQCTYISPSSRKIVLAWTGGDVGESWTFDFSDPKKGFRIHYEYDWGW